MAAGPFAPHIHPCSYATWKSLYRDRYHVTPHVECEYKCILYDVSKAAIIRVLVKGKAISAQAYYSLIDFQDVEAPRFQDNQHMKVVMLSSLRTGRIYSLGNIPGAHFC
jgi:hypothetical protein